MFEYGSSDLILVSDTDRIFQSGVINTCFSDHCVVFCTRKLTKISIGSHNTVKLRSLKRYNKDDFQASLLSADWSVVLLNDNVSDAWSNFKLVFMSVVENIAPVKQIRKTDESFEIFKSLRNNTQEVICNAKKNFFVDTIEQNKNNSKSLWKSLKELGLPSKNVSTSSQANIGLKVDENLCFDKNVIAETFNSFYTTVAAKLVEKLLAGIHRYGKDFVNKYYADKGVILNNFSFSLVTENKVYKYPNTLSANKATGLDDIPARFVKDGASIITSPLAHVVNLSLIQGVVPGDLKIARVVLCTRKVTKHKLVIIDLFQF